MFFVNTNPRNLFIYLAVSAAVTLTIFFTVMHSTNAQIDKTNHAVQQTIDRTTDQITKSIDQDPAGAAQAGDAIKAQATKLADCIAAAGTDANALATCQAQFGA